MDFFKVFTIKLFIFESTSVIRLLVLNSDFCSLKNGFVKLKRTKLRGLVNFISRMIAFNGTIKIRLKLFFNKRKTLDAF